MIDQILEAWRTNNRIDLFLLERIDEDGLRSTLSTRGGRDVARQFAHLHDVRIHHLEARRKALARGLRKFATKESPVKVSPPREELAEALAASGEAVERYLAAVAAGECRGLKKGSIATLAYFVAHESHHRGSIILTLKQCGHPLDAETRYAIWDWDRR
jgi:uncharacterized damage-inducible protein DinB